MLRYYNVAPVSAVGQIWTALKTKSKVNLHCIIFNLSLLQDRVTLPMHSLW